MHKFRWDALAHAAERWLVILLFLTASGFIGLFYFIALRRFGYPLPLEWNECGVLDMMRRVACHLPLYVSPSKNYVPFLYTPIYFYVGAALSHLTGVSFFTLRLLSILATSGCFVLIFNLVRRNTRDLFAAWIACGLFAALYAQSGGWFDLARVDMLYLFFLLFAIDLAQRRLLVWAAIMFVVAFQTKQTAATVALFVLSVEIRRPRRLLEGLGTFGAGAVLSSWLLNLQSLGWYRYYAFFLPAHHAWVKQNLVAFLLRELVDPLGVAVVLLLLAAALYVSSSPQGQENPYFVLLTTIGITVSCFSGRLHMGGAANASLPLYAWICILFGLSLHVVLSQIKRTQLALAPLLSIVTLAACGVQFAQLLYFPGKYVPTATQKADAVRVLNRVSTLPGNTFVMHRVIDVGAAGKQEFAGYWEIWDVLRGDQGPVAQKLKSDLINSFQNHEYAGILSDEALDGVMPGEGAFLQDITTAAAAAYPKQERMLSPSEAKEFFANPSESKPEFLYLPR
jgi:hypothetical protein